MKRIALIALSALTMAGCASGPPALDDRGRPLLHNEVDNLYEIYLSATQPPPNGAFNLIGKVRTTEWTSWDRRIHRIRDAEAWFEMGPNNDPKAPLIYGKADEMKFVYRGQGENDVTGEYRDTKIINPKVRLIACPKGTPEFSKESCLVASRTDYMVTGSWRDNLTGSNDSNGYFTSRLNTIGRDPTEKYNSPRTVEIVNKAAAMATYQKWREMANQYEAAMAKKREEAAKRQAEAEKANIDAFLKKSKRGSQLFCESATAVRVSLPLSAVALRCGGFGNHFTDVDVLARYGWMVQGESRHSVDTIGDPGVRISVTFMKR